MTHHSVSLLCCSLVAGLLLAVWSDTAAAQQAVKPSAEELELINEGAAASDAGDYPRAIDALQRALRLGELNVTWLNLGRALQKDGQCYEADEALLKALEATPVIGLEPATVAGYVERYREELRLTCPGRVVIRCTGGTLALIDEGGVNHPLRCAEVSDRMTPGVYRARLEGPDGQIAEQIIQVTAMETTHMDLLLAEAPEPISAPLGLRLTLRYGWVLGLASGALQDEAGRPLDELPLDGAQDELDGLQVARIGHSLEARLLFLSLGERTRLGLRLEGRLPTVGFAVGAAAEVALGRLRGMEVLGGGHLSWGPQELGLRAGTHRFTTAAGPWHAGLEVRIASPFAPSFGWSVGLGVQASAPDLALATMLQAALHLDL